MKKAELEQELIKLCDAGYIQKEQVLAIQKNYLINTTQNTIKNKSVLIFGLLGVIFAGAGTISLFAFNWSAFSMHLQTIVAFIPLLLVQVFLYIKVRSKASNLWIELLSLGVGLALTACFILLYNTYQLDYPEYYVTFCILLLLTPLAYYLHAYYLVLALFSGILFHGLINYYSFFDYYTFSLIVLLPFYILRRKKELNVTVLSFLIAIWLTCIPVFLEVDNSALIMLFILFYFALLPFDTKVRYIARIFIYATALFFAIYSEELVDMSSIDINLTLGISIGLGVFLYLYAYLQKKYFTLVNIDFYFLSAFLILIIMNICFLSLFNLGEGILLIFTILYKALIILLAVFKIVSGLRASTPMQVTRYLLVIALYIFGEATMSDVSLVTKGIFFILIGASFFITNYILSKRVQNEA